MENYYVQFFPIKESEIKEILKIINLYSKNNHDNIDAILSKNNCSDTVRDDIYASLNKCISNKQENVFDVKFGTCIAELQKIYRTNFSMKQLSFTELVIKNNIFDNYTKKWIDILNFKQNKFEFVNYLKYPISSGVYIPFDKIQLLYEDYFTNNIIQKYMDNYFGDDISIFLNLLEYCKQNECGLLEARGWHKIEEPAHVNPTVKQDNINNTSKVVNNKTIEVKASNLISETIALYIGFSIIAVIIFETVENIFFFKDLSNMTLKSLIAIPIQIIINLAMWKLIKKITLTHKSIRRKNIKKVIIALSIFMILYLGLNLFMKTIFINNKIKKEVNNNRDIATEMVLFAYQDTNLYESYNQAKEQLTELVRDQYAIYLSIYIIYLPLISFSMLFYFAVCLKKCSIDY